MRIGATLLVGAALAAASDAPVVPLPADLRDALSPLGAGVVGQALPAAPIENPARLFHLTPGRWTYRVVAGANKGQTQTVQIERIDPTDRGADWRLVDGAGIQELRETTTQEVVKVAQEDTDSDRTIVYRPGLVLDPRMAAGEPKTVKARLATYEQGRLDRVEYEGSLEYTTRYVGAYRVTVPAGSFDARLLEHAYEMKIGPATAQHRSFVFYADEVGRVAEVSREKVSALIVYNRSSLTARVLVAPPTLDR